MAEKLEVECGFRPHEKYESIFGKRGEKQRLASYHGSYFWGVKGFGTDRWVVAGTIEGDFSGHPELPLEELAQGCVNFLNRPVGKRKKRQPYGTLELFRVTSLDDGSIQVLLMTDQKKNKDFWGRGQKLPHRPKNRR